mgnify:FL=1
MLNKIEKMLGQLNDDELRTLNSMVVATLKANNKISSIRKSASLYEGQEVEINQVKHRGQKFIITKVNRTRCKIQAKDNSLERYNCPISMLIA